MVVSLPQFSKTAPSNPRIILHRLHPTRIIAIPRRTRLIQNTVIDQRINLARPLYKLQRKPLARVPPDMAVHEPRTGVVGLEGDHDVAGAGEHGDVAARRVGGCESDGGVVGACVLGEEIEVMAVL